jgi:iron complex outermembrane receptor protein
VGELKAVVVTAQRRNERIQDVPITMSAFSGDTLEQLGATKLEDVANSISNVQMFKMASGQPTWIIRGVGLTDFSPNNTPTAAVYQDDVYLTSTTMSQLSMFDIERVEVLKGPQGGIYGRNASGGAVKVMSVKPEFGATQQSVSLGMDNWKRATIGGSLSTTLQPDTLATRIAFNATTGVGSNVGPYKLINSDRNYGAPNSQALRVSNLLKLSPENSLTLIIDAARDKSETPRLTALGVYTVPPPYKQTVCNPLKAGQIDNANCASYAQLTQIFATGSSDQSPARAIPGQSSLSDPFGQFDVTSTGATLQGQFKIGGLDLTSISNLRNFDYGRSLDGDASRGEYAHSVAMTKFKVGSQEFRLQQNKGDFKWSGGLSYAQDDLHEDRSFLFRDAVYKVASFAAYGVKNASELIATLRYDQVTQSSSAFGQFDWAFAPLWSLGGSLRYTDETKTYRNGGFGFDQHSGAIASAVLPIANDTLQADYQLHKHWSGGTTLRWQPDRQTTVYASLQRGFKVGGFFGGFPLTGTAAILPYKEETNDALELGVKWAARSGRYGVNAAVFEYHYQDAQAFTTVYSSLLNGPVSRLDNIGRAKHQGAELETFWRATDVLRLDATVGYLDAKFLDDKPYYTNDGKAASYKDQQRLYAAKWSWTLRGQYDVPLSSGANVHLSMDVNSRTNASQSAGSPVDAALQALPGYTLANARVTYNSPDDHWKLAFYVKNLANKAIIVSPASDGLSGYERVYGEPRTFGLEGRMSF